MNKYHINREDVNLKWYLCLLFRRHKWGYAEAGGKSNYNCSCESIDCCSIPVYELTCLRCGLEVTIGEDELINCFAKKLD